MSCPSSFALIPLLVAASMAISACSNGDAAAARARDVAAKKVQVEAVREQTLHRSVEVVGTLAAVDEATVSAEAEGRVTALPADLGDRVKAGEPLIELDREKAQYNFDSARAALARALAQYGAPDTAHLPPIEKTPDVQRANAELVQAQQNFDRAAALNKRELLPRQGLDDAEAVLQTKKAGYDTALQGAKNLKANIEASDANLKLADRQLRDTYIRAPFDGYVSQRLVNTGQFVKNQQPVMTVVRVDPLKVIAEIPEKMTPWMKVGQAVDVHVDAYPDKTFEGKLSRISPSVNTSTRAFPFEALVNNRETLLKPGTFARVHISSDKVDTVMSVPYAAIQYRYGVNRVFVVDGDHLQARELKVGERIGDRIEIASGVKTGENVALTDVDTLTDGTKVMVGR
jgi:multidrug efflux pump subunit AcrA (membrane-fusion protein)